MITRCLVPNTSMPGTSTSTGMPVDIGRPGVVQHQMVLPQGQVAHRMQLAEKITSPRQSPGPNNNRVNIVTQQGQPTILRVEKQPMSGSTFTIQNPTLSTPLPTTLALPQVPISSAQLSVSMASSSKSPVGHPSPAASPTLSYSRATPSPGRTIYVQQQSVSPQAAQGTGTMMVRPNQGNIIQNIRSPANGGSTLIVQNRPQMPSLPNQPVAANQLPELFQRPRPPPPPNTLNTNQNFQNVRILQTSGALNTGVVKTILIPCTNGGFNNGQPKVMAGKQVFQIASNPGEGMPPIPTVGGHQQPQSGPGHFVNNTGTPLPTSIQLPSEPVPFTSNEMSQLGSNSMIVPTGSPSAQAINNGRPSPIASPSRIILRQDSLPEQSNGSQFANSANTTTLKAQDGAKIMIQVDILEVDYCL